MNIQPIKVAPSQTVARWHVMNKGGRPPELYTDLTVCVVVGEVYYMVTAYKNEDGFWFAPLDDSKIKGVVVAWADLDASRNALANVAANEWRLWL